MDKIQAFKDMILQAAKNACDIIDDIGDDADSPIGLKYNIKSDGFEITIDAGETMESYNNRD